MLSHTADKDAGVPPKLYWHCRQLLAVPNGPGTTYSPTCGAMHANCAILHARNCMRCGLSFANER